MKFIGTFFEKYASVVSLILTGVSILVFQMSDRAYKIYFISFILLSLLAFYYIIQGLRFKGYYKAFKRFNSGFADIHSISNVDIDNHTDLIADKTLVKNFLSSVQKAFEDITQTKISVCIKILIFDNQQGKYFLYTFSRDGNSENREALDIEDANKGVVHWLESNSSFNSLFQVNEDKKTLRLVKPYYIKRFMPWSLNYKNSRVEYKLNLTKNHLIKFMLEKNFLKRIYFFFAWPVEYRCTIVVPIIPYKVENLGEAFYDSNRKSKIAPTGLLCIDSNSSFALELRDVEIMRGLADGIYNDLKNVIK